MFIACNTFCYFYRSTVDLKISDTFPLSAGCAHHLSNDMDKRKILISDQLEQ